jgi:hypothetical protein
MNIVQKEKVDRSIPYFDRPLFWMRGIVTNTKCLRLKVQTKKGQDGVGGKEISLLEDFAMPLFRRGQSELPWMTVPFRFNGIILTSVGDNRTTMPPSSVLPNSLDLSILAICNPCRVMMTQLVQYDYTCTYPSSCSDIAQILVGGVIVSQINKRVLFLGCINDEHAARRQRTCLAHE